MSERLDTWIAAARLHDEFCGFSADEIERMPFDQYARLRERAGLDPVEPSTTAHLAYEPPEVATTVSAPEAVHANADALQGIDPQSDDYFLAWRQNRARGGEGRGIFDSVGSRSDAYTSAVRAQASRAGYSQSNVVDPPRIEGRYVRKDDVRDTRPASERFSTPDNAFGRH